MKHLRWNMRLCVQVKTTSSDPAGQPVDQWNDVKPDVAACVEPISGREFLRGQQADSSISHIVTTPFFPGSTASMRLVRKNGAAVVRIFEVESVVDLKEQNRWLQWRCTEAAA